jgi:hypothetical protein
MPSYYPNFSIACPRFNRQKSLKHKIVTIAIGLHFFLILIVVTHLEEWIRQSPLLLPITLVDDYYSAITFSNRNFGFFAPDVTSDWNIHLILTTRQGQQRNYAFILPNQEMKLRMYSMAGHFGESDDIKDLFARSWALKAINENPDVRQVDVEVSQNNIPTMEEYRQGKRITSDLIYRTTFDAN